MPITKSKAFVTSDNQVFLTREDAQKHEIFLMFKRDAADPRGNNFNEGEIAQGIMDNRNQLVALLKDRKPRTPKVKPPGRPKRNAAVNAATQPAS